MILVTAGVSVVVFLSLIGDGGISISVDEVVKELKQGSWEYLSHQAVSASTITFSLRYRQRHKVEFMLGVEQNSKQFYPREWRDFPGIISAVVVREIISADNHAYKWQVLFSKPDEKSGITIEAFTYLVGDRSAYTYTGAGSLRVITSFLKRRVYPCSIIKIHIPATSSASEAKMILDNFRKDVVPGLHRYLKTLYRSWH